MNLNLDALEAVARAATPGPWSINWESDEYHAGMPDKWALSINGPEASDFADLAAADAEHMATFDPPTVLALIAGLRSVREDLEYFRSLPHVSVYTRLTDERDEARAKLREAEAVIETVRAEQRDYSIPHDEALSNMGTVLATYKPTNQEGSKT